LPEDMPDRMQDMPDRMPDRMPEDMSDRMPEDLPITKCINVMVGITRSKVIDCYQLHFFLLNQWLTRFNIAYSGNYPYIWYQKTYPKCLPHDLNIAPLSLRSLTSSNGSGRRGSYRGVFCGVSRGWQDRRDME